MNHPVKLNIPPVATIHSFKRMASPSTPAYKAAQDLLDACKDRKLVLTTDLVHYNDRDSDVVFATGGLRLGKFALKRNNVRYYIGSKLIKAMIQLTEDHFGPVPSSKPGDLVPWKVSFDHPLLPMEGHWIKEDDKTSLPIGIIHPTRGTAGPEDGRRKATLAAAAPELLNSLRKLMTIVGHSLGPSGYYGENEDRTRWNQFDEVKEAEKLVERLSEI